MRQSPIQFGAYAVQSGIPEQPIDTLQTVSEGNAMAQMQCHGRETHRATAQHGADGARECCRPFGVHPP